MHATVDSALDPRTDALAGEWLSLKEAAARLGIKPNRIKQLISEHRLLAVRREGEPQVPAAFIKDGQVIKGLPGTLTLLSDAGFDDVETIRWLFTADDTLPGTPVDALTENRGTEVRRRAQAMAF
ncbi:MULTISPECIES: Rv2175c family DNA-binding protein [Actinomadura]|uniref:Helix-turn-helix domain-containing protein n=3 Tax=Actinomadura TaxID=1988 RepID=A0A5D0NJG6_9ACTN|nr:MULTISPECIES: Rv2175c family DNA-binding protein [Actinomadura]TYB44563.1 helix-turn-helix domain-containing protein [Actinomadura chibensis]TYC10895.1 helix-turn-helix domain-containing protein [Actinomadura syzygii]TYK47944.1 helix-turn-helix domain-containing protein [Actinomadura decatromicini]